MLNKELLKYASLASQIMATLGVAFFLGYRIDKWIKFKIPIVTLVLPLLALIVLFWKVYKDSKPKNEK